MKVKALATSLALALSLTAGVALAQSGTTAAQAVTGKVQLQQIRNATVRITYGDTTFLVDPMLSKKGSYPGFEQTYRSELRNPLVELPMPVEEVLADVDAVIITHTHLDHWDDAAQQAVRRAEARIRAAERAS